MKELSLEEKAKRYDEAIERAKKWLNAPNIDKMPTYGNRIIEEIFPELKESEDEKIRKEILDYIIKGSESCYDVQQYGREKFEKWIAWLEKQSELSNKMKIQQDDIQATDEELILFYRWLNDHELQCQRDEDAGSAELFASIKSMFIEVFGKWITKKN